MHNDIINRGVELWLKCCRYLLSVPSSKDGLANIGTFAVQLSDTRLIVFRALLISLQRAETTYFSCAYAND